MEPLGPRNLSKTQGNVVQAALDRFENGLHLKTHYGPRKSRLRESSDEDSDDDDANLGEIETWNEHDLSWKANKDQQRGSNLINFFFQLFKSQHLCDFVIKFGTNKIGIHSLVLVEHSDKFYNLLCCQNSGVNSITLAKTSSKACIEMVLDYMYTGEIDLTEESVDSVVNCAQELDLQRLVIKCEEFKRRLESPDLCFRGGCDMTPHVKSAPTGAHSDILELDVDSLCTIIADDSILADNEVEIFSMVLAWLTYKSTRHILAKRVLSCIRFYLMTPTELASHVETQDNLMRVPEIKEFVYQAYKYHALRLSNYNNPLLMGFKLKSRKYFQSNNKNTEPKQCPANALSMKKSKCDQRQHAGGSRERNNLEKNQCDSKCLQSVECSVGKDEAMSACYNRLALNPLIINNPVDFVGIQQDVFVFGGTDLQCSDTELPGRQVLRLSKNVGAKRWERISTLMPVARTNHCAVSIGGAVPVKELEDNFAQPTNTTIAFDTESCEWISCSSMHQSRIYFTAATWKGRIFVFGGQGIGNSVLNSVETFDPAFDKWTPCSSLPTGRVGCCSHEFQDKIFVIGGYAWINGNPTALNDVYTYYPVTGSYYQLSNLSQGLCYASLTTTVDSMWLFGGAESGCHETQPLISIPHVRVYDSINDKWKDVSCLNTPRHDCSTVAAGKKIFIVGGLTICNKPLSSVECFDTENHSLVNNLPDLPCPSAGTSICIVSPYSHRNYL